MRYHVLATDYDGTLAHDGRIGNAALAAMERLLATGRKLVLVTGRRVEDLMAVCPDLHLFARVVAENGATLYHPGSKEEKVLADAPPPAFLAYLRQRKVSPLEVGRVIVATNRPHETAVLAAIRDLGLEMQVIFNKDSVMALPSGVNKATGLKAALKELGLTPHEVVGIGDAENDHAFLSRCECAVAVADALPAVRDHADLVTHGRDGDGVAELIDAIVTSDLAAIDSKLMRHHLLLGTGDDGADVRLPPYGYNLLIAGPSGSGKSTAATGFLERLTEQRYQYCIIDPEGDYENMEGAVTLGSSRHGPTVDEVLQMLTTSTGNVVINLVGLPLGDRPPFFMDLLPRLQERRARTARPHWLIVDEAHHLLPASWEPGPNVLSRGLKQMMFITVHADLVARGVLATVDTVIAVGREPETTLNQFMTGLGETWPGLRPTTLDSGEVLLCNKADRSVRRVRLLPSKTERRRHTRKYAEGVLPPDRSFYFRGPEGKLNLRAQNLILFMQLADGVDDDTWTHHLRQGDYSRWFRENIKDDTLADEAAAVERADGPPTESRKRLRAVIERYYTLPAGPPLPMPGTDAAPKRE